VNSFSDEAMHLLTQAAWPGNVRELQNAVERLVVLGREAVVLANDLAFLQPEAPAELWPPVEATPWTLKQMSERYLQWALSRCNGNKPRAAEILGINLSTLYRWERAKQ
jgi:two-component system response regulator HydG